ncbi:divergent polysaccharide deacetylase family protein [Oceanicoccus sagamiensis]|uniref:Divergent polysaccharide deacetylase family protein n=1 Tax=Oceanicoccus sagamiensis TaxID=716816 RepID=A0A1X9NCH2_9GAMM|nr:divergent polysaccharide deacetylase family protein [Oceanicoccus sagamiensis]ARN73605.1 hypothetical protein BST96_05405 [Oceanicoccus sagamiensis]
MKNIVLFFWLSLAASCFAESPTPRIVLIIDDMGNNLELGQRAIALPGAVSYAFLPHSSHSKSLANEANRQQKEILLHAPMSNLHDYPTGPGTLTPKMNQQQFLATLADNLASIPHAKGVNNHMGSLLTQLRQPMSWLMQALKQQNLYFVDSRTSPLTVAERTAREQQLPTLKRDVFLDNQRTPAAIAKQFDQLIRLSKQQGQAVAIGHPYPETLAFLEQQLPLLAEQGVMLVNASGLVRAQCEQAPANCSWPENVSQLSHSHQDK